MVADNAYDIIRDQILRGELAPGARLRAAELQDRLNLGLTPIREALLRLTSVGLVSSPSGRGASVREASVEEVRDVMRTRRHIERACLVRSIELGDTEWEGEVLRAYHILSRTPYPRDNNDTEGLSTWEQHHRKFHHALVAACDSHWLMQFRDTLVDHSLRYRWLIQMHYAVNREGRSEYDSQHLAIMEATLERDASKAADLMDAHLTRTENDMARLLSQHY